ncbi:MAG: DUF5675 family protein [Neptuniibacter sp.]
MPKNFYEHEQLQRITVERFSSDNDATLSLIFVDDQFICFGLEDEFRTDKVPAETRIPAGEYEVSLRVTGGFHNRYEQKFSTFHEGMLWIRNVPNFQYILIHIGNTDADTAGCLLVGEGASTSGEFRISNSTDAYKKLYQKVSNAAHEGRLVIEFIDRDREEKS